DLPALPQPEHGRALGVDDRAADAAVLDGLLLGRSVVDPLRSVRSRWQRLAEVAGLMSVLRTQRVDQRAVRGPLVRELVDAGQRGLDGGRPRASLLLAARAGLLPDAESADQ